MKFSKAQILRAEQASRAGELQYTLRLKAIMRAFNSACRQEVEPHLAHIAGVRMDVTRWGIGLEDRLSQYIHQLEEHVQPSFDQMSQQVVQGAIRTQSSLLPGTQV